MLQSNHFPLICLLSILTFQALAEEQSHFDDDFFKTKKIYDNVMRVEVRDRRGAQITDVAGNGVFVSKEGQLITSNKLIEKALEYPHTYEVVLITRGGTEIKDVELGSCDDKLDLCILKANYTLEEPIGFTYVRLDTNEIIGSLQVSHEGDLTFNKGKKFGEAREKGIPLFVTSIPYTKNSLGLPVLNKFGEAVGIITDVKNSSLFAYQSYAIPSKDVSKFMKGKFSFTSFKKKEKELGKSTKSKVSHNSNHLHQKSKYKSKKSDKYSKIKLKQKQMQQKAMQKLQQLLQQKGLGSSGFGPGFNGNRGGEKEKTQADIMEEKVKELMAYKEDVKKMKEEKYKELLKEQNKLMDWEQSSEQYKKMIKLRKEEIETLQKLNRRYSMSLAKNKAKLRSKNSGLTGEERSLLEKSNVLTGDNIKLTDAKITKLKEELRQAEKKLSSRSKGKKQILQRIGSLKDGISQFDKEMKEYEEEAFDQFGDAI